MRSRISALVLALTLVVWVPARAVTPLSPGDLWPSQVIPVGAESLPNQLARIDLVAKMLPPEVAPAVRYQKVFLGILAGNPDASWADEMRRLAAQPGDDGVTRALRDVAKTWVARLEMAQIGDALRGFYRREIRFPEKLALVEGELPEALRRDPWGEPWVYHAQAPEDFGTLGGQSYQLGPTRFPKLSLLRNARGNRKVTIPSWRIKLVNAAGKPALEFRSPGATALIQPGGMADGCALLYIGQGWALMAQVDQLFTVAFSGT